MIIATVMTGDKYNIGDVLRIKRACEKYAGRKFRFYCITDNPMVCRQNDVEPVVASPLLPGWWAKMKLFDDRWRDDRVVYFDLDTLICGDLGPLLNLGVSFGICANFTRAIKPEYPCKYGSCIMTLDKNFGHSVWLKFLSDKLAWTTGPKKNLGDQYVIEKLCSYATYLQDVLPHRFLIGYRDLKEYADQKHADTSIVVYAGKRTPDNFGPKWAKEMWNDTV